jgi:hypothetical protein
MRPWLSQIKNVNLEIMLEEFVRIKVCVLHVGHEVFEGWV